MSSRKQNYTCTLDVSLRSVLESVRSLVFVLMLTLVLLDKVSHPLAQEVCAPKKHVGLSLVFSTNSTGHPNLKARLEQPLESDAWELDVDMGTTTCGSRGPSLKVLWLTLNGSPFRQEVPSGYVKLERFGFFRRGERALNWTAARDSCAADGTTLALPASQEELEKLQSYFTFQVPETDNNQWTWLGASDLEQEGKFVTPTGVPFEQATSMKWISGEPNGGTNENCLQYYGTRLNDYPCGSKAAFFCKVDL